MFSTEEIRNIQERIDFSSLGVEKPDRDLSYLDKDPTGELLKQRKNQREKIFDTITKLTKNILYVYFGLVVLQSFIRIFSSNWLFMPETGFKYLTAGIFVYFLGVVIVIVRSLWDEKPFIRLHDNLINNSSNNKDDLD